MAVQYGGYRDHIDATATTTTHTMNFDPIPEGHKVYWTRACVKSSKGNADVEYYIVSGGQEFLVQNHLNLTADRGAGQVINTWIYAREHIRVKWYDIAENDTLAACVVGEDKWEVGNE